MDSLSSGPDRPVIFLPGYGRDETIARALELGVTDYVVKPFSPTELVTRIQAALRKQAGPTEPFRSVFGHDDNTQRLLEPIGNVAPVEYEMNYYRSQEGSLEMARLN